MKKLFIILPLLLLLGAGIFLQVKYDVVVISRPSKQMLGNEDSSKSITVCLHNGQFYDVYLDDNAGELLFTDGMSVWSFTNCDVAIRNAANRSLVNADGDIKWNTESTIIEKEVGDCYIQVTSESGYLNATRKHFKTEAAYNVTGTLKQAVKKYDVPVYNNEEVRVYKGICVSPKMPYTVTDTKDVISYGVGTDFQNVYTAYVPRKEAKQQLIDKMTALYGSPQSYGKAKNVLWVEANGYYGIVECLNANTARYYYASEALAPYIFKSCSTFRRE